jgi:subtilisin family serine protease
MGIRTISVFLLLFLCSAGSGSAYLDSELSSRLQAAAPDEKIPVIVQFKEQAPRAYLLSGTQTLSRQARREILISRLKEFSRVSQQGILDELSRGEMEGSCSGVFSYWIFNGIRGSLEPRLIKELSEDPGIEFIAFDGEPMIPAGEMRESGDAGFTTASVETSWASRQVGAPPVWRLGYRGQGVVVGMVDTGVNYNHSDLANRLWHNEGEIPGNGLDDDGNGYIDDYIGFNFGDRTGDPMDYDGHGTWTASIVVGDGTAGKLTGAAPEARIICCKWGSMGTVWEAFQYCTLEGADIVSASVGSLHGAGSYTARSICDNMLYFGVVLSAAAGNGAHNNGDHEPAPYDIITPGDVPSPWSSPLGTSACITVGATAPGDGIASFSSWGPTEWSFSSPYDDYPYPPGLMKPDVCAPGVGVPGASYTNPNGYMVADGTSGATPCNAGVIALILCADSTLTPVQIDSILETSAIDLGIPGKDSLYGAGRVDALLAIAAPRMCWLSKVSDSILDGGTGDGDGRPEAGESDSLIVTYYNHPKWRDAASATLKLSCSDPEISIVQGTSNLGIVPAGDTVSNLSSPFVFTVSAGLKAKKVQFEVKTETTPESYEKADTITMMVGHPSVLVVDDDGGGYYEQFYEKALDNIPLAYDEWDVSKKGLVAGSVLNSYCLVIWFTGDMMDSTLTASEITSLQTYLDAGNPLFLTGQNIGQEINATSFYSNYLHASFVQATTNDHTLTGEAGDPIGDGFAVLTAGSPGAGNQTSQDIISPLSGAEVVFRYQPSDVAGIKYDSGTYRVVYFGFGFEGIASRPDIGYAYSWHVLRRVIKWLGCPEVGIKQEVQRFKVQGTRTELLNIVPNPVTTTASIRFVPGSDAGNHEVSLGIYDISGRLVKKLLEGKAVGEYSASFDAGRLPSGVYFCRLEAGSVSLCRKIIVVK